MSDNFYIISFNRKVNLLGTSGGAWVSVNTSLERPDLKEKLIADSFDGRTLHQGFAENLLKEREYAKHDTYAKQFYEWCQGEDWETVVDLNTQALIECAKSKIPFFSKPLENLTVPILLTGSLQDEMCRKDILEEYQEMKKLIKQGNIHIFNTGGHPAIATTAEKFADIVSAFLHDLFFWNMILKFTHIPIYILIFLLGIFMGMMILDIC